MYRYSTRRTAVCTAVSKKNNKEWQEKKRPLVLRSIVETWENGQKQETRNSKQHSKHSKQHFFVFDFFFFFSLISSSSSRSPASLVYPTVPSQCDRIAISLSLLRCIVFYCFHISVFLPTSPRRTITDFASDLLSVLYISAQ